MSMLSPASYRLTYSIRRLYVDSFMQTQVRRMGRAGRVLDVGGHKSGKRGTFDISRYDLQVVYTNLTPDKSPDVQANGAALPFAAASFDAAICAELLEHVPDPRAVLAETARVLRPGGRLVITVPFLYPIHADPYDFGRYTDSFWRQVLGEAGFTQIEVTSHGYFFSVLLSFLKLGANQLRLAGKRGRLLRAAALALLVPLQVAVLLLERTAPVRSQPFLRSFTTGYGVTATRP